MVVFALLMITVLARLGARLVLAGGERSAGARKDSVRAEGSQSARFAIGIQAADAHPGTGLSSGCRQWPLGRHYRATTLDVVS